MKTVTILFLPLLLTCSAFLNSVVAQDELDRLDNVILLVTTRNEIEKLFGQPVVGSKNIYELDMFRVTISFSAGKCREAAGLALFDVPKETAWKLVVGLKKPLTLPKFLAKYPQTFDKGEDVKFPREFVYANRDASLTFRTKQIGEIEHVEYFVLEPREEFDRLRCREKKDKAS